MSSAGDGRRNIPKPRRIAMIEAGRAGGLAQAIRGLVAFVAVFVLTVSADSAQDPYVVERVPVDVTAANASEARDRALDEAYGKAFDILVERTGVGRATGSYPVTNAHPVCRQILEKKKHTLL